MQQAERTGAVVGTELNDRIFDVIDNLEYRRVISDADFQSVSDLRRKAFDAKNIYEQKFGGEALEDIDFRPDTDVFGLHVRDELVATIRINILRPGGPDTPAIELFGDTLRPLLEQGLSFVDPSRFAVSEEAGKRYPGLPLLTLRLGVLAVSWFNAFSCLQVIKLEHAAFYRRIFRSTQIAGPNYFEGIRIPVVLMSGPASNIPDICRRYPLFNSTETERRAIFARDSAIRPARIRPTARQATPQAA